MRSGVNHRMLVADICQVLQTRMLLEQSVDLSLEYLSLEQQKLLLVQFFCGIVLEHVVLNELELEEFEDRVCGRAPGLVWHICLSVLCAMPL